VTRRLIVPAAIALTMSLVAVDPDPAGAAAAKSFPVKTSRGEFQLLVFAPDHPAADRPLVLLISGEGGWRRFDDLLAGFLAEAGY